MSKAGYVAIIGRPNAGKSTLLNATLNTQISIVSPKAQTTRERVMGILTEGNRQIVFVDTPGIHQAREGGINDYMVGEAREALDSPDLIWYLVDPQSGLQHEATVLDLLAKTVKGSVQGSTLPPIILLMNKADTAKNPDLALETTLREAMVEKGIPPKEVLRISALEGTGLKELMKLSWTMIPSGEHFFPDPEQVSDRPVRFFVGEKIREQLFRCLGDEVPYSCAVEITDFQENAKPVRVEATIYVERDSQKGIVIGKGAKKIKEIGSAARVEIEDFLGHKIFLGLKVDLLKNWTQNASALKRMGYNIAKGRKSK